ncbi:MAG TPA: hypothetical protein VK466_16535 [Terriglobales bacterium]|nr:hypothetical protein [Terriglobales bacterium]
MPLARIITRVVEDSLELTMQLRARGFQVETVAPDQSSATPADLEVHLEECDSGQVVGRAVANPSEDLWVFVAPGALDERARPMRVISLVPKNVQVAPTPTARTAPPVVLRFRAPEDDPILSELESDLILAELEASRSEVPCRTSVETLKATGQDDRAVALAPGIAGNGTSLSVTGFAGQPMPQETPHVSTSPASERRDEFRIPLVPERVAPVLPGVARSLRAPHRVFKVSVQAGPKFWRTAWIACALIVLITALGVVVGMRSPLPSAAVSPVASRSPDVAPVDSVQPSSANRVVIDAAHGPRSDVPASSVMTQAARRVKADTPKRVHHARSSHVDDIIAEDTVVFYDRAHGVPASRRSPQTRYPKYSDRN